MKRIANFTQTYSTNRLEVANNLSTDKGIHKLFQNLDKKYFSFHNVNNNFEYCKQFALHLKVPMPDIEFLIYTSQKYTDSFLTHLNHLKDNKFTDCLLMQDDAVCTLQYKNLHLIDLVVDFYRNNKDIIMLNLDNRSVAKRLLRHGAKPTQTRVISEKYNLYAYEFDTLDWSCAQLYNMDDSTYIGNIDQMLDLYDSEYSKYYNMDQAESYINTKCRAKPLKRWVLNRSFFRYFSYVGMHVYNEQTRIKELKKLSKLNYLKTCNT
jgi:hypothetical protein